MTTPDDQVAPHAARFLDMLDGAFRRWGCRDGLPPPLREAVAAVPRHRFVHRFRIGRNPSTAGDLHDGDPQNGPLRDTANGLADNLPVIYSDAVMRHVDAAGAPLPSSNSQPSFILFLVHLLGLAPGHAVLEIGSGSGWLAAVMSRLVGPTGRVTGIELIPDLAAQSRTDLAAIAADNVRIITGDGTKGHAAGAPYQRAIITAAAWSVPTALLGQLAEGGLALIPIELRGGGCAVTVLRRRGDMLVGERTVPGWFVPLLGGGQERPPVRPNRTPEASGKRYSLPLCMSNGSGPAFVARQFGAFLARTEPDFAMFDGSGNRGAELMPAFGLIDAAGRSIGVWRAGEIGSFGDGEAASRLARSFARWAALGLPGAEDFTLDVHPLAGAPVQTDRQWVEPRGASTLVWRLKPRIGDWRDLLDAEAGSQSSAG